MVPVSDYIKKLLFQYDCIVVPELGGFILHYIPAMYVENTGLYMPPRKKIAFNEALRLDDGLLINYMMLHEGCSRDEVVPVIRHFVDQLKQQVRQQQIFAIEGLGLFSENEEGKLQFDPEIRHNFQGESYGFQPVAARLVNSPAEQEAVTPVAVIPMPKEAPIAVEAEEVPADGVVELPGTHSRRQYLAWAAAVLLVCTLGIVTVNQSSSQLVSSLNPFELFRGDKQEEIKPQAVKTDIIPLAETPSAEPVAEPTLPVAEAVTASLVEKHTAPIVPVSTSVLVEPKKSPVYYLAIAGSFASRGNARKLVRQLHRRGFETAYILPPRKAKELVKVAALGSPDKNEILQAIDQVSKVSGARAWVHKVE
ncbi:SPOR domain-containing protein [Larkinella insperata]|uniref:SPOR domain-containing protein n=1 Tax=Larkinella insperata TaxID=332158 RepID=A0ABW3QIQ7_9BACT|nr:SPOR domain-containing protein [Larkinella insperata]